MTRFTHLILLLLCLALILGVALSDPGFTVKNAVVADPVKEPGGIIGEMVLNPEAVTPLPDLDDGYLFTQDRFLDENDLAAMSGDKKEKEVVNAVDLEEVSYEGSIIIGDLRKALIAYPLVKSEVKKGVRRSYAKAKGKTTMKHEQVNQGQKFMGFLVANVDENRIVFEKDGQRVEKFLYDQGKDRVIVEKKVSTPAANAAGEKSGAEAPPAAPGKALPPADLAERRSQRRLKALSGAGMPQLPAGME